MRIKGEVRASMKKAKYNVDISYHEKKGILEATCTCPRGNVACHHMSAILYHAHYHVSATDMECQWSAPRSKPEEQSTVKLKTIFPLKRQYKASQREVTTNEIDRFKASLGATNVVGFAWLLRPEPSQEAIGIIPDVEDIIHTKEYLASSNKEEFIQQKCQLTPLQINNIERMTQGQHTNPNWYVARKHRLTASKFGMVLAACKRMKFPPSLFKNLAEGYNLDRISAVQWGKENEATALADFKTTTSLDVQPSGLWLDQSGILGASPDGMIGDDCVLEIKCPFKYRTVDCLEEAVADKKYFYWYDGETINVKDDHNYYHQAQGQMYLTNR